MCGLCGVLSPHLSPNQIECFKDLLAVSVLRGSYGAGIAAVPRSGNSVKILKLPVMTSAELAYGYDLSLLLKENPHLTMMMGHARQPTTGGLDEDSCHPHVIDDIVGMHNGTLTNVFGQKVELNDNDSQMLFQAIAKNAVSDVVAKSVGSYALTYIDKRTDSLYFLRNEQRPLFWATVDKENVIYWASESEFLNLVLSRNYVKKHKVYSATPNTLVSFRCRPMGKVAFLSTRKLDQPQPQLPANTSVPLLPHHKDGAYDKSTYVQTAKDKYISIDELKIALAKGCVFCSTSQEMHKYTKGLLYWTDQDEFVCQECAKNDATAQDWIAAAGLIMPEEYYRFN